MYHGHHEVHKSTYGAVFNLGFKPFYDCIHPNCVQVYPNCNYLNTVDGPSDTGVSATDDDVAAVDAAARKLERLNPNPRALKCDLLNGEWELLYTTSASILGSSRPWPFRPLGSIYQTIDATRLRAANRETFPFFNAVDADLAPTSAAAVAGPSTQLTRQYHTYVRTIRFILK